jgi:hypothetical protein
LGWSVYIRRFPRTGWALAVLFAAVVLAALSLALAAPPSGAQTAPTVSFGKDVLAGETSTNPTSLQFGPDGRLYVAQQDGTIQAYTVKRNAANDYTATNTETINLVKAIPNHNDNGQVNTSVNARQVTGMLVVGTAQTPIIYVGSSDPRIGGGADKGDVNLDTNSGVISKLTKGASGWTKQDLVRGLSRSEENHSINGMQLSGTGNTLYVAAGGNTNKGAPSNNFALLPEVALSAAILKVDLAAIGGQTYDLPTLDDPDRAGSPDQGDPFGGNNAKNQAKLVSGGPVQVFASGFRNPYDLVIAQSGKMYTVDNGGNGGWGDIPKGEGPGGNCTNEVSEPGTSDADSLHYVTGQGYYGGHPSPTRANKANTFGGQSPIEVAANPVECDYRANGAEKGNLTQFTDSTNGIDEYTASNFGGAMKGDLLTASFNETIYRLKLNSAGDSVALKEALFQNFGSNPLDVTAQGDNDPFPGTVWSANHGADDVTVFEPADFGGGGGGTCDPSAPNGDADGDDYTNSDEQASGTDPCSAASVPPDYDGDKVSNKTDADDDNDSQPDTSDPFAVDPNNGKTTNLPVRYTWDPGVPDAGGLEGSFGFTGLMTNGSNYQSLYDPTKMTVGGAAGAFTVDAVPNGDAKGNTQEYGFQSGVSVGPGTGVFTAHTRVMAPFAGITPQNYQSMGLFIGTGDQDNYAKLVITAHSGNGGIQFAKEQGGAFSQKSFAAPVLGSDFVDLYLTVDPAANTVQPSYSVTDNGVTGARTNLDAPAAIPAGWVDGTNALAAGFISTSNGIAPPFPATWDFFEVVSGGGGPTEPPPGGCTITGTSANDTLTGTSGNDVICGGGGNDTIKGAGGNDTIKGEGGADKLFGEAGDDALDGGTGNDTADFSGSLASVTASLASGTATGEGSDTLLGVDSLIGSSKVDALSGNGGANTINGGGANDTIEGLGGNDKLTGSGGNDTLRGGAGNDSVVGSGGADSLFGDDGDDAVNSKDNVSGNDSLDGGAHVNGDTAVTDATEKSVTGFP